MEHADRSESFEASLGRQGVKALANIRKLEDSEWRDASNVTRFQEFSVDLHSKKPSNGIEVRMQFAYEHTEGNVVQTVAPFDHGYSGEREGKDYLSFEEADPQCVARKVWNDIDMGVIDNWVKRKMQDVIGAECGNQTTTQHLLDHLTELSQQVPQAMFVFDADSIHNKTDRNLRSVAVLFAVASRARELNREPVTDAHVQKLVPDVRQLLEQELANIRTRIAFLQKHVALLRSGKFRRMLYRPSCGLQYEPMETTTSSYSSKVMDLFRGLLWRK